jgi:protein-S-isoprenylcysteine O-methyltransferase Ste14
MRDLTMGFRDKYVEACINWFRRDRSRREKLLSTLLGGLIFSVILPIILAFLGGYLDNYIGIHAIIVSPYNILLGLSLSFSGLFFASWSVYIQLKIGYGTPVPAVPTKRLITSGPYKYSRNPMALGTIVYYLGLAFILNSLSMIILIVFFATIFLSYIKLWEEKELEARFGDEYLEYKRRTPFLIPLIGGKRKLSSNEEI